MGVYKSALGRPVDMAALAAKNEKTRAVGNMKVNARGDQIDSHGRIIKSKPEQVNNSYAKTVTNPAARPNTKPTTKKAHKSEDLTQHERELEESFDDDMEVEKIKEAEVKKRQAATPSTNEYANYQDFLNKTGKK